MRYLRLFSLLALVAVPFLVVDMVALGQRRGGGGGRAGGGYRGAAGGARVGGYAAGGARVGGAAAGPYGGTAAATRSRGTVVGPTGRTTTSGSRTGSVTTPRGGTINYGGAGQKTTGPLGGTAGRGVGGVQVTTPGGQTYSKAGAARGAVGPGGRAVGTKTTAGRAVGPGGAAAGVSRTGVATGPRGTAVGGTRTGVAAGPYGYAGYTARGGAAATRYGTRYVGASTLRTTGGYVRQNFYHYNCFTPNWYAVHRTAWRAAAWTGAAVWAGATWNRVAAACSYSAAPVYYDYGTNLVYQDNQVYYEGEPIATAEGYAEQAVAIADKGKEAEASDKEEWIPLGVFGMVKGEEKDANTIFQLAINRAGVIRGNYYDALSDTTLPVYGSMDKKSQRAAWTVGDHKDPVYETGVANLTEPQTALLVHFGKDRTQQWTLVRLEKSKEGSR